MTAFQLSNAPQRVVSARQLSKYGSPIYLRQEKEIQLSISIPVRIPYQTAFMAIEPSSVTLAYIHEGKIRPLGGTPQDFAALLAEEGPRWLEVVRAAGVKFD